MNPIKVTLDEVGHGDLLPSDLDFQLISKVYNKEKGLKKMKFQVTSLMSITEQVSLKLSRDESCASDIIPGLFSIWKRVKRYTIFR